eukprot:9337908-Prorocentrum_lima.AAC.1
MRVASIAACCGLSSSNIFQRAHVVHAFLHLMSRHYVPDWRASVAVVLHVLPLSASQQHCDGSRLSNPGIKQP